MDSSGALASPKGYGEANGASSRSRPLHICAISFMAISHRIYIKAQGVKGPIGTTAERIATLASPFVYIAQYLFLASLSSLDDCILAYEDIVGSLFPQSNYVFDKIEDLVRITESLPRKFDVLMNKFPTKTYLVPFLDWALAHLIAWLNFLVCELAAWGLDNTREKDIMIDRNYSKQDQEAAALDRAQLPIDSITLLPDKNKEGMVGLTVQPIITNETCEEDDAVGLTVEAVMTKEAHPASENGSSKEDGMAQAVGEKESCEEDDTVSFTVERVTEKESYEEHGMVQTQSGLYKEDSIKGLSKEGRAGLMIEPISTEQSVEEENKVSFTIQPTSSAKGTDEEESKVGFTVKPANSCGSNMVGLMFQPISRKGSYKEVLERGKKEETRKGTYVARKGYDRAAKDRVERGWLMNPRRAPTREQNGKKNRTNFPRSASYT